MEQDYSSVEQVADEVTSKKRFGKRFVSNAEWACRFETEPHSGYVAVVRKIQP
jgi:hypothetical protein